MLSNNDDVAELCGQLRHGGDDVELRCATGLADQQGLYELNVVQYPFGATGAGEDAQGAAWQLLDEFERESGGGMD